MLQYYEIINQKLFIVFNQDNVWFSFTVYFQQKTCTRLWKSAIFHFLTFILFNCLGWNCQYFLKTIASGVNDAPDKLDYSLFG